MDRPAAEQDRELAVAQSSAPCPIHSGDDENQGECQVHQGLVIRVGAPGYSNEGGSGQQAAPPDDATQPPDGGGENQGCRDDQVPLSRVRRLSARDDTVPNKRRKYTKQGRGSKRVLDQQLDGGQKRICFHSRQQLGIGVEPSHQIPVLQQQGAVPLQSTGQTNPDTQHVDPVQPLHAELGQDIPLTPGLAGLHQGVASDSRATPTEPCGWAGSSAL